MSDTLTPKGGSLDLPEITQIVELMAKNNLSYFQLERNGANITLRRGHDLDAITDVMSKLPSAPAQTVMHAAPAHYPTGPLIAAPVAAAAPAAAAEETTNGPAITSPMVGTFYRSSGPGEKPFVEIGQQVDENTTVCIIEAMKVMNEIKAEKRGTIARIIADDGKPVQFGQQLFALK
jgi:acetyl-CoA carboxylase biotin carboxyl carrier protein